MQPVISSVVKCISGRRVRRAGRGCMNKKIISIEIIKYFNYDPRLNGLFLRNSFPRIKDGAYVIILDDKKVKGHIRFDYSQKYSCIL